MPRRSEPAPVREQRQEEGQDKLARLASRVVLEDRDWQKWLDEQALRVFHLYELSSSGQNTLLDTSVKYKTLARMILEACPLASSERLHALEALETSFMWLQRYFLVRDPQAIQFRALE